MEYKTVIFLKYIEPSCLQIERYYLMDSFYREVLIQCILGFVECVKLLRMTPDVTFLFLLSARQYVYLAIKGVSLNDHNLTFSLATTHLSNDSPSRRQTHYWQDEWQRRDRFRHSTLSKCQKKKKLQVTSEVWCTFKVFSL